MVAFVHDPIVAVMCWHGRRKKRIRGWEGAASTLLIRCCSFANAGTLVDDRT
jgi:hypothetical protein